ncbi:2'-5' RNA ligase family protein [Ferrovibrio terrae]|uniref:2'-5' RNA ligase family protein n=1 Tax=Ferrovibrio terrae TaxID=2594003 RepID=A0A516GY84_9PROT|nr:2'-5' RNA ligase family protein [Ferrovibrio terrae]QDO96486.1 2'-5' RNA ligase family protein [Ferrovibrio terrae]
MLAVIAVPDFAEDDAVWIDTIRRAHDPQYESVPAHVTLVFPFESADPDWFAGHVAAVAAVTAPINVALDRLARIDNPHQPKYRFLNVLLADAASAQPLTALYHALGGKGGYEPHVTLTRFGAVFSAKALERQLGELGRPVQGRIAALEILEISHGAIRRGAARPLAGRT